MHRARGSANGWRDPIRAATQGLTTRGRSFLAAGAAAAVCAVVLGQRDLLRIGILLLAVPAACVLLVARARFRISCVRTIAPARVPAGEEARVRLEVGNVSRLTTGLLMAEEKVPYALGSRPRFVVDRLEPGHSAAVTYRLRAEVRGRYHVGPLRLRMADPFGMCEVTRSFTATDELVVVPRTVPLEPLRALGDWAGSGRSVVRSVAASGEDDVATREYRHGDDLRRVHWRSTARRGELMVRREEQPRQARATVLLDTRHCGHRGDGPASSFEWAVVAAASAALHLIERGYGVRVLTNGQHAPWHGVDSVETGDVLDRLAVVSTGEPDVLHAAIEELASGGGDGLVVAVLGEVDEDLATDLARQARRGSRGVAVLLRTTAWTTLPPKRMAIKDADRARAGSLLEGAGWAVTTAEPGESMTAAWGRLRRLELAGGRR